ncbi:PREDICTED: eukaryotic translation initiation factor 2D isoform X2 [Tarenaya hassleriana]|uniref:eukaryotic translation initiation factor 2D isoform X2 n=1 Tax=Tarenaya hassleriana TaxID=28532 RepID=UPI00053C648E|nr:PREDICTED: eukaryotic translation initiation factor 2D isoform X2 [Tarenaya hassleriana]
MFKKAVEAKSQQRLSGADRKKLRRTVRDRFPLITDALLDLLLPPKNRVHVFSIEGGVPMFFDVDGRGTEFFPTVFALWEAPQLLPSFTLKGCEVSRYVIGGADLMFPGIMIPAQGLPSFSAGEPWAVKVPGNPAPIAVGCTTMSSVEALKAGLRGKALRITHYYHDFLWESTERHYVPNAGFLEDVVMGDPSLLSSSGVSDTGTDVLDASAAPQTSTGNEEDESIDANNAMSSLETASTSVADANNETGEQMIGNMDQLKLADDISANEPNTENLTSPSAVVVDSLLDKCLLQALYTTIKDKDLPMPGSTLWSNHVLPCRPSGLVLDIKKSSYKKLSKWLQAKASAGLISVKEDKHKKEVVLFSVNRGHPDYISFKPEKRKVEKSDSSGDHTIAEAWSEKVLEVVEIYKPSTQVNPIFESVGANTGKLYTASEASDVVFRYIEKEDLVKATDKSMVVLDAILCDALFKGAIKKGTAYPTEIHKKEVGSTFIGRMQPHNVVTRGGESMVRKGAVKPIQILSERRQGNKKVTKVSGVETFMMDAESLASELQKKFACSTSVGELPGKKGREVLIQGGVIDDVGRHLMEQYGVPKRYIQVLDKTRK